MVGITSRQTAVLDFARKVADDAKSIDNTEFDVLHAHGFSDEDVWGIAGVTAFLGLSNRMANFASMRPNHAFYAMGRNCALKIRWTRGHRQTEDETTTACPSLYKLRQAQ